MRRKRFVKELERIMELFVSCDKCVCLLKKRDAHEVVSLGWSEKKYADEVKDIPADGVHTGFELYAGATYEMPITIRKYYCKKCKPREKKKGKK